MVELTGLDAYPAPHEARVGVHKWTLGEVEPFGPARYLCQLGLGAREIAAHAARPGQIDVRRRERVGGLKPRRVNVVLACGGQARRGLPEVGAGGIELAAQKRQPPETGLDRRTQPRPPLVEARPQRLEHLGGPAQVSAQGVVAHQGDERRKQLVIPQVGAAQL